MTATTQPWPLVISFMYFILILSPVESQHYNCSAEIIPTLDGAWMCDHSWIESDINDHTEELQYISDGDYDTFVNVDLTQNQSWTILFKVPKYFAISKMLLAVGCKTSTTHNSYFSIDVWDEYVEHNVVSRINEVNWINVKSDVIIPMEYEIFEGFSLRSPYWRLSFHGTGEICLREVEFFVRAGTAALLDEHSFMQNSDVIDPKTHNGNVQRAPVSNTCAQVQKPVPSGIVSKYKLDTSFYAKYTSAYGIPIMSSRVVDDRALQRACYVVRFMLAHRSIIRNHMYSNKGRVAIIGRRERVPNVPEMRQFYWFTRRAAGGTYQIPVNVGAEENMLCEAADGYAKNQDIFMHEFAHGIHLIAAYTAIPDFNSRLQKSLNAARSRGLWRNTYANTDNREYFAEGVQAYFNQQRRGPRGGDGIQNDIYTREKLKNYDRNLYNLVNEIFPCTSMQYIPRCDDIYQSKGLSKAIKLDCKGGGKFTMIGVNSSSLESLRGANLETRKHSRTEAWLKLYNHRGGGGGGTGGGKEKSCKDDHEHCEYWAKNGECNKAKSYMKRNCRKSCKYCPGTGSSCVDKNKYCASWARTYCSSNEYVKNNCKKSCKVC